MTLTSLHKRIKFAENNSIEILASKFLVVMGTIRRLSHTVLSGIVSYVRISEQVLYLLKLYLGLPLRRLRRPNIPMPTRWTRFFQSTVHHTRTRFFATLKAWPDHPDIRTWPRYSEDLPANRKRNFLGQGFQKFENYRHTDTQTDATENNTTPHSQVVIIKYTITR